MKVILAVVLGVSLFSENIMAKKIDEPSESKLEVVDSGPQDVSDETIVFNQLVEMQGGEKKFAKFIRKSNAEEISDAFSSVGLGYLVDSPEKVIAIKANYRLNSKKQQKLLDKIDRWVESNGGMEKHAEKISRMTANKEQKALQKDLDKFGITTADLIEFYGEDIGEDDDEEGDGRFQLRNSTPTIEVCSYLFNNSDRGNWPRGGAPSSLKHSLNIDPQGRPKKGWRSYGRFGIPNGSSVSSACATKVRDWGSTPNTDDAGHIMGKRFGGWNKRANLAPQNSLLNQIYWNHLIEAPIDRCVNDFNWQGQIEFYVSYDFPVGSFQGVRPARFYAKLNGIRSLGQANVLQFTSDIGNRVPSASEITSMTAKAAAVTAACN